MITFYLSISVDDSDGSPVLYKKELWPVLPREGECYSLKKHVDIVYVDYVHHGQRNKKGEPVILVDFIIRKDIYEELSSSSEWSTEDPSSS